MALWMIRRRALLFGVIALWPLGGAGKSAGAAEALLPAVIYDIGGKGDRSFNEAAYNGAERFRRETGIAYRDFEIVNESQREQAVTALIRRGANLVIAVGFGQRAAVEKAARDRPDIKFTLIDSVLDLPNVQSVMFREHEGSFLVGMIAALASKTGKIGFVGGMDIPLIRKFALGYAEGARYANPAVDVLQTMTGTTPAAWRDPTRGAELARSQFDRGVDVVYAAAGTTGLGVLQAAKDAGKLSIGVDSNQNHLHPGSVLTSMVKRVDLAVYESMQTARTGAWQAGTRQLGLAEKAVDYALDDNNRTLITPDMEARVEAVRAAILAGRIKVSDYTAP